MSGADSAEVWGRLKAKKQDQEVTGMGSCFRTLAPIVGALSVLLAGGRDLLAQAGGGPDCEYAACALRVKGGSIVKGVDEQRVIGFGIWVGDLDQVFAGSPISQDLAASFRHRRNVGSLLSLTGLAVASASLFITPDNFSDYQGVTVSGFVMLFAGVIVRDKGLDRLHRAIWEYTVS